MTSRTPKMSKGDKARLPRKPVSVAFGDGLDDVSGSLVPVGGDAQGFELRIVASSPELMVAGVGVLMSEFGKAGLAVMCGCSDCREWRLCLADSKREAEELPKKSWPDLPALDALSDAPDG